MKRKVLKLAMLISIASTATANEMTKAYLVTSGSSSQTQVIERITERVVVKEETKRNKIRIIGGVQLSNLNDTQAITINDAGDSTEIKGLPNTDDLMYGAGYDRTFGWTSLGGSYMRNKSNTKQMVTIDFGLNW